MNPEALHIEPASPDPIYRQIVGQIVRLVAAGQCPPGTRLPSVREVAAVHAINPMTVSKAYSLLEEQGVLERLRGIGMVVAAQVDGRQPSAERAQALAPLLAELSRQARQLDLDFQQVTDALRPLMENKE
ncbi:GntR family transcriptional regulator [Pseudomonas sp. MDMC216]|nr:MULTISPECIES: GntR family transcriptional regulator [unclassified Pseudomonas]MDI5996497.1 GntR family transcriptional regulator [Pseudomonas sp. MDMC216]MDI6010186.1 GntR family transcriptional regulator [Pseudomonas sp. MDMC17]RAR39162.1 GntR family transcriptional regulator [Pseudomonas sp. MDMC224]